MSKKRNRQKKAFYRSLYILLFTWMILLILLITVVVFRLQGYETFSEWKNRNVNKEQNATITSTPNDVEVITKKPEYTKEEQITLIPEPTVMEEQITLIPTPTETLETKAVDILPLSEENEQIVLSQLDKLGFSGQEEIDRQIREKIKEFAKSEETIEYRSYSVGNYFSIVFRKMGDWNGQNTEFLLPLVYDVTQKIQVTGSDFIKETYFAIIKERLQSVIVEKFPEKANADFVSYEQPYKVNDYEQFYLTNDSLVFYFAETTLTETEHAPFIYETNLKEAEAFLYLKLDGTVNGIAIRKLDPNAKMIALTYDDGPFPKLEEKFLQLFDKYDAKVTFFFVGNRITGSYKTMVKQLFDAGHEIASHTFSHPNMRKSPPEVVWPEVNKTNLVIAEVTGYAPDYIRLPQGYSNDYLKSLPMPIIDWDLDSVDWKDRDKDILNERIREKAKDGCIVLLHSIRETTYEATELFLPWLIEQGYEIVTLSELFYYKGVTAENGVKYDGFGKY